MNLDLIIRSSMDHGPSSYRPKLSLHQNPCEINMNSDHFQVNLCVDLYSTDSRTGGGVTVLSVLPLYQAVRIVFFYPSYLKAD